MNNDETNQLVVGELGALSGARTLFREDPEALDFQTASEVYGVVRYLNKFINKRRKAVRDRILEEIDSVADADTDGHKTVEVLGGEAKRQRRVSISFDDDKTMTLLRRKGINLRRGGKLSLKDVDIEGLQYFLEQNDASLEDFASLEFKADEGRLEELLSEGAIDFEDLHEIKSVKTSYALMFKNPPHIETLIQQSENENEFLPE